MARLPQPGGDAGNWGSILNDYLAQAHKTDGSLKNNVVGSDQIQAASVTNVKLADTTIAETKLSSSVQTKLNQIGSPAATLPLFNVETYGAVGNGTTDDYAAIKAAWDAMLASPNGGLVYFPRAVTYRVDASVSGRVAQSADSAYALFPLPMVDPEGPVKKTYGLLGVGNPYAVRTASSFGVGGNAQQVATASVLFVDYSTPFAWSGTLGLPSVIGAPDADITGHTSDNIISNIHFSVDGMIIRQPDNPSLCGMNLEMVSTVDVVSVRFDVVSALDSVPEPTHPTGASLLAPKSNNNVAVLINRFVAEGHYTGVPYTEHIDLRSAIVLRCKIGVSNRRVCSHFGTMHMLKIEQCPYGLAGYTPSGAAPNGGIVAWHGGTVVIDFYDAEDYAYEARAGNPTGVPWIYTPTAGSHIYAPNGGLTGQIRFSRINSEPPPPTGIGIAPFGANSDIYVNGNTNGGLGFSSFAIYAYDGTGVATGNRHLGSAPVTSAPNTPTVGTATAGVESATVAFTPSGSGPSASSFTATSTPGNITGTASSSPITVSGLTAGVSYTFTVHATNAAGSSAESGASNSVTPTASVTLPSDTFNRADSSTLGTSSSGAAWLGDTGGSWGIASNRASNTNGSVAHQAVWMAAAANARITADVTLGVSSENGINGRVTDASNYVYLDLNRVDGSFVNAQIFNRSGGSFSPQGSVTQVAWATGDTKSVALDCNGTTFTAYIDAVQTNQVTISGQNGTGMGMTHLVGTITVDNLVVS